MKETYRFSSYSIVVPLDCEPENVFMMHGYTGAIDVLSKEIAEYLQDHDHFSKEDVPCSESTVEALEKRGYITKWSKEEEVEYAKRLANALYRKENILNNNFTVVVTYDCNFRCPYCYENGIKKDTTTFTKEKTDKLYKTILEIAPHKELRNNFIALYGGEPLLKENKEAITYLVEKGRELGFKFYTATNGFDLDNYVDLLAPDRICFLQITIDGMPMLHNQKRIHKSGNPTFEKIVSNIGLALKKDVVVSIRVNTDKSNIGQLNELNQYFKEIGYLENEKFSIYSALLVDYSENGDLPNIIRPNEYIKHFKENNVQCSHQDYGLSKKIISAIKSNRPISLASSFCGAQNCGFVLDPIGNIYPCWEVVNRKENQIGHYREDSIVWNDAVRMKWRRNSIIDNNCIKCKYAFLCRGGCPALQLKGRRCTHIEEVVRHSVNRTYVSVN